MSKETTKVRKLYIEYRKAEADVKIAKGIADKKKAELMEIIPENTSIDNIRFICTDKSNLDNKNYIKHLISLIPKTKQQKAKEDKLDFMKSSKYRKISEEKEDE